MMKSHAVPELDEKISGLKTEISWKLRKILVFLEKQDDKKEPMGGLIECIRNEYDSVYAHFDNLTKEFDDSPKEKAAEIELEEEAKLEHKKWVRALLQQKDEISNSKNKAVSHDATLITFSAFIQNKLYALSFRKKAADATIAKQTAHISKLTEELTRAGNLKLELQKRNEKYQKIKMELLDRVQNTEKDLKSSTEKVERIRKVMDILQLKEAQAKMASKVDEKINQTLKGMDTLSVKFEEDFGGLVSRIYEIENEFKVVMKWISDNKTKQGQLKQEIAGLVEQLKEEKDEMEVVQKSGEDEMRRLNQSVKRGEEKIDELEKMIAEKDEQMREMETKINEKESMIWSLSKTLESVISTATTKISKA